jgi:hypothetical protein
MRLSPSSVSAKRDTGHRGFPAHRVRRAILHRQLWLETLARPWQALEEIERLPILSANSAR